jgi:hypothetical protein
VAGGTYAGVSWAAVPHAALLAGLLRGRIGHLMATSLAYLLWFVGLPLWQL